MTQNVGRITPVTNTLFQGDNLEIMKSLSSGFIDLVYLDPPFFTEKNYQNIWGDRESVPDFSLTDSPDFHDTSAFFEKHITSEARGLKAYLEWLRFRLAEVYRLLKPNGNFFLHLDYHAVHYAKVMLDEIFGYDRFQNEIIWKRKTGSNSTTKSRRFPCNNDTILFYRKGKDATFNPQFTSHDENYVKNFYRHDDLDGRGLYRLDNLASPSLRPNLIYNYKGYTPPTKGWRVSLDRMKELDQENRLNFPKNKSGRITQKRFLNEMQGNPLENIWSDIGMLQKASAEKTGWPTQKPVALVERIIMAASNEGDMVFDCFAGCGTAMHAAHNLRRRWVGIDISPTAVKVNKKRLLDLGAKVRISYVNASKGGAGLLTT